MGRAGRGIPIASAGVPETHFMCLRATHCLNAPNSCEYLLFNDPGEFVGGGNDGGMGGAMSLDREGKLKPLLSAAGAL